MGHYRTRPESVKLLAGPIERSPVFRRSHCTNRRILHRCPLRHLLAEYLSYHSSLSNLTGISAWALLPHYTSNRLVPFLESFNSAATGNFITSVERTKSVRYRVVQYSCPYCLGPFLKTMSAVQQYFWRKGSRLSKRSSHPTSAVIHLVLTFCDPVTRSNPSAIMASK